MQGAQPSKTELANKAFDYVKIKFNMEQGCATFLNHYVQCVLKMKIYNLPIIVICVSSIALGIFLVAQFHTDYVSPIDMARSVLVQVQATSDPQTIQNKLVTVERLLPVTGNPVLISPTEDTDFGLMQNDLKSMLGTVNHITNAPSWSSNFHTGMLNVHAQAATLVFNLLDTTPYLYASPPFVLANILWLLGAIGLVQYASIKKK